MTKCAFVIICLLHSTWLAHLIVSRHFTFSSQSLPPKQPLINDVWFPLWRMVSSLRNCPVTYIPKASFILPLAILQISKYLLCCWNKISNTQMGSLQSGPHFHAYFLRILHMYSFLLLCGPFTGSSFPVRGQGHPVSALGTPFRFFCIPMCISQCSPVLSPLSL